MRPTQDCCGTSPRASALGRIMRAKKDVRGPSSLAGLRRHGMVMPANSRGCGCVGSDASSQTSSLSRRSSGQDRGGGFLRIGRGDDRRAGDLRQLPPLPLWRRLVAVGRGDDAGGQISVPCLDRVCGACDRSAPRRASTPRPVRFTSTGLAIPCLRARFSSLSRILASDLRVTTGGIERCQRAAREQSGAVKFADSGGNPGALGATAAARSAPAPAPSAPARA